MDNYTLPHYPDIVGTVTGGDRFDGGLVHMALAVRPRVVRAGSPCEVVFLVQNHADMQIEVRGKLLLPAEDAQHKPGRFDAGSQPLTVSLRPAEAGYAVLPVTLLGDIAPGDYTLALAVETEPTTEPGALLPPMNGHTPYLPPELSRRLLELKSLAFSTARRGLFGLVIEAPLSVIPRQAGLPLQPDWVGLWSPGDTSDVRPLLARYGALLRDDVLPLLRAETLFGPLSAAVEAAFVRAGYPVHPAETGCIARLMVAVMEMAHSGERPGNDRYHVGRLLAEGWPTDGRPIPLPHWCRALLERLDDPNRLDDPVQALAGPLLSSLLRDAVAYGFEQLYVVTGIKLGSDDDEAAYADQLVEMIQRPSAALTFVDVYLPLVLGGIIVSGSGDPRADAVAELVAARSAERLPVDPLVYELIDHVLRWARE